MKYNNKKKNISITTVMILVFIFCLIVTIIVTLLFDESPIIFNISLYGKDSFWESLIVNIHSSLIDFLFLGILVYYFTNKLEEKRKIESYYNNIDDSRFWFEKEATSKLVANIRRLNDKGYYKIDLSKCFLMNAYLKEVKLIKSQVMGANFEGANLKNGILNESNFKGVSFKSADCRGAKIINGKMKNIKCNNSDFQGVDFSGCDFTNAELINSNFKNAFLKNTDLKGVKYDDSNFERANLLAARNIDINRIIMCKTLKYAKLDEVIEIQIQLIKPELLK
ncbi:MAG: pentapeptide repeat-containing protein [Clostridiaceae bacterium]